MALAGERGGASTGEAGGVDMMLPGVMAWLTRLGAAPVRRGVVDDRGDKGGELIVCK